MIAEGLEKFPVDLIAYQWMSNHWHMVLSPQVDGAMSAFIGWITLTYTQRYHAHHGTAGFERNALTAKLVKRAEDYRWGSLYNWLGGDSPIVLAPWPVRRLPRWVERVNEALTDFTSDELF